MFHAAGPLVAGVKKHSLCKSAAKVQHFFDMTKYFAYFLHILCVFFVLHLDFGNIELFWMLF